MNDYEIKVRDAVKQFIVSKGLEPAINNPIRLRMYGEYSFICHHEFGDRNRHIFVEVNSLVGYNNDGSPLPVDISNIRVLYRSDEDDIITRKLKEILITNTIMSDKKYTQLVLDRIFTYHKPSEESIKVMQTIREKSKELAQYIVDNCPDEDETLKALDALELVSMHANASIARHTPSQSK